MIRDRLLVMITLAGVAGCGAKKDAPVGTETGTGSAATTAAAGAPPPSAVPATAVATGGASACALMKDGTVRCWGRRDYGEVGGERQPTQAATPVAVAGVSGARTLVAGGDGGAGGDAYCVLGDGEQVTCWGYPESIPLRTPGDGPRVIPALAGARSLALGGGFGLAVMKDGTVHAWGRNTFKERGLDAAIDHAGEASLQAVPGVSGAIQVAAGQNHGCALLGDGTATCWGTSRRTLGPTPVAGATDLVAIAAGTGDASCAVRKDGAVLCWDHQLEAAPVAGITDATAISMWSHRCAQTRAGAVLCWGYNGRGQLGVPAGRDEAKPAPVAGIADAAAISAGRTSTCALRADGAVACWGYNRHGQLGDGTLVDRHQPAPVVGLGARDLAAAADGVGRVTEATTAQAWDDLPAACKRAPLQVRWDRVAGDRLDVKSGYARVQADGKTVKVVLASFNLAPTNLDEPARGSQVSLGLRFAKVDLAGDRAPQPVDPGTYALDPKQERLVYVSAADRMSENIMLADVGLGGATAGTVTLATLDGGWVCGELAIATKSATITGPFAARVLE